MSFVLAFMFVCSGCILRLVWVPAILLVHGEACMVRMGIHIGLAEDFVYCHALPAPTTSPTSGCSVRFYYIHGPELFWSNPRVRQYSNIPLLGRRILNSTPSTLCSMGTGYCYHMGHPLLLLQLEVSSGCTRNKKNN